MRTEGVVVSDEGQMWDRRFAEQPWPTEPDPFLVELALPLPAGRALDIASGPGRNSLWLATRGWQATAVDASQVALTQTRQRAADLGVRVETVHADVTTWRPKPAAYDLVVVANLHPGVAGLREVLTTAATALVPGGHLFVVGHDLVNLGRHGPPDAERLLSLDRLAQALPDDLQVERLERRTRPADDGSGGEPDVAVFAWAVKAS